MSAAQDDIEREDRLAEAEKLARLSQACRYIGGMMEAGVDILRITRVLRSQTEDEDILRLCDHIDFDLKMGRSLVDALAGEPSLFSPFAVSLVRQGEERNTLAQSFARLSDFLDRERADLLQSVPAAPARASSLPNTSSTLPEETRAAPQVLAETSSARTAQVLDARSWAEIGAQVEQAESRWLRAASAIGAGLLAASALAEALSALGLIGPKWQRPIARLLSAAVLAAAALSSRRHPPITKAAQVLAPEKSARSNGPEEAHGKSEPPTDNWLAARPPTDGADGAASGTGLPEKTASQAQAEENEEPRAIYHGAPREDEEEEAPRNVRRPRHEEEFD